MRITPNQNDLDMMISKFIINLPSYELKQSRLWVHFEKAFHFFIDEVVDLEPLTDFQMHDKQVKQFFTLMFKKLPSFLQKKYDANKITKIINDGYSLTPVYGVVVFNMDQSKILLVEGHKPAGMYSIPKGKINQGETPLQCACRQAKQQIGITLELDQRKKIQVSYSKNCIFYLCKIQECNINVSVIKNSTNQKKNGRKNNNLSKQIKSLAWININTVFDEQDKNKPKIRFNMATKKAIQKIQSQKTNRKKDQMLVQSNRNLTQQNSHPKQSSSQSIRFVQKHQASNQRSRTKVNGESTKSIIYKEIIKNPFDGYKLNRLKFEKLFMSN